MAFEHLWLDLELFNLLFPLKLHPVTLERQLNYLKCFVIMPLWQSNNLIIILCHQSFLLHCLSLTCWKRLPFLENILFFSYDFKNIEQLISLVNSNTASREPLFFLLLWWYHCQLNWRAWSWQYVKWTQSRLCTLLLQSWHQPCWNALSGPNLDLLCVQQLGAVLFCENYAKLYFDAKHLEKGLNWMWWDFWFPLSQKKKKPILANIGSFPNFLD